MHEGKELDFVPDFARRKLRRAAANSGGKAGGNSGASACTVRVTVERMLVLEAYDDFPDIALVSATYKNTGKAISRIDQVLMQQHRFNANVQIRRLQPYDMWSFQGSSYDWGKDDILKLTRTSSQPNVMGEAVKGGYGGGIPVVAFWTRTWAKLSATSRPCRWTLSIPVKVDPDGRVNASIEIPAEFDSEAGRNLFHAAHFVAVYAGDFYEPLRMWSSVLQKEGWDIPEALERSLQRELVRLGIRVQCHARSRCWARCPS